MTGLRTILHDPSHLIYPDRRECAGLKRVGIAELPLHGGRCPRWLFIRMERLGGQIAGLIIHEYGRREFLRRMSDPFFFQALGCTLGFDWHSSGLTTTVCSALKEGIRPEELGIAICGGKGRVSRQTQQEIAQLSDVLSLTDHRIESLKYASRMAAKVDNSCVQDGYQLYHHSFIFSEDGDWAVIQQGMQDRLPRGYGSSSDNEVECAQKRVLYTHERASYTARRYHWLSDTVGSFVEEPHSGIVGGRREQTVLDMTARESQEARKASVGIVRDDPSQLRRIIPRSGQLSIDQYVPLGSRVQTLVMPAQHAITEISERTMETLHRAFEIQPESYEELVAIRGVGPRAIRALALVSELVYGAAPSWRDPVKYSFAHGGKDGIPYPVDRANYRKTIDIIENATRAAEIGEKEKMNAIRRLHEFL